MISSVIITLSHSFLAGILTLIILPISKYKAFTNRKQRDSRTVLVHSIVWLDLEKNHRQNSCLDARETTWDLNYGLSMWYLERK